MIRLDRGASNEMIKFIDDSKFKDSTNIEFGLISAPMILC